MRLASKTTIKSLLKKHKAQPLKRLGQNFLIDKTGLNKLVKAANIQKNDIILEIGPGIGALTQELAKRAKKIIAVEKDERMIPILQETLAEYKNVDIVQADILLGWTSDVQFGHPMSKRRPNFQFSKKYKVVANLPYYITAPVIRKFLEAKNPPQKMVLMTQKEVAQRLCAKPPKMNLLAICAQVYAEPKIITYVSKNSFWPRPKVESAIIKITPKSNTYLTIVKYVLAGESADSFRNRFFKIVKAGFSHPRKQLVNNLSTELKIEKEKVKQWLLKNGIQPNQRSQTLTVENWLQLTKTFCYNT